MADASTPTGHDTPDHRVDLDTSRPSLVAEEKYSLGDASETQKRAGLTISEPDSHETTAAETEDISQYHIRGIRLLVVFTALLMSILCQALDDTIIANAIPRITDTFGALNDIGWYGSAYFITNAAFQLFYGKMYSVLPLRWVFLWSVFLFEVGSLIAAVAPTSPVLIGGRAVAGTGAAGITSGAMNIMSHVTPREKQPIFISLIGATYGIACVIGPLVGGVFAERVTWRWCFYINLPIGGASIAALLLTLNRLPKSAQGQRLPLMETFRHFDIFSTATFAGSIICLLIVLNWAPIIFPWSSGRIVALLTVFAVLLVIFIIMQIFQSDKYTTIPRRIAKNGVIAFGALFAFCQFAAFNIMVFYLPIYFQAVKDASPIRSGIDYLPLILINTPMIILSGALTAKIGSNEPWIWASSILMSIGAGLLTTLRVDSSTGHWVGYQILFALGSGCGLQQPFVTAQRALPLSDISVGIGIMLFAQLSGGAIFISIAQTIFSEHLAQSISRLNIPGLDASAVVHQGATELRTLVSPQDLPTVLGVYNEALTKAYQVGLIMSCISILGPAGMRLVSLLRKRPVTKDTSETVKEG